jgi:hypothetical protein
MSRADRRASRAEAPSGAPEAPEPLLAAPSGDPPPAAAEPIAEAPAAAPPSSVDLLLAAEAKAAELQARLDEAHAALAEAREELSRQKQSFDSAWADREEHFRSEHNALASETKLAEAAAQVLDLAPKARKARKAAATFTLLVDGTRKTFRAGDLIPETADLSALPAWATEAA